MYSGSVPVSIRYKVFDVRILWLIEPFIVYCEGSSLIFNTQVLYYCTISYWICFFRKYCLQFRDTPTYNKLTRSRVRRSSDLSENLSNIYLVHLVLCLSLLSMMKRLYLSWFIIIAMVPRHTEIIWREEVEQTIQSQIWEDNPITWQGEGRVAGVQKIIIIFPLDWGLFISTKFDRFE